MVCADPQTAAIHPGHDKQRYHVLSNSQDQLQFLERSLFRAVVDESALTLV